MNKISTLSILTGLIIAITSTLMITVGDNAFAIEYTNFTSEKYGIQFEYPSDWKIQEKTSRFDTGPDLMILDYQSSRNINFVYSSSDSAVGNLLDAVGLEEFVDLSLESAIRDFEKEYGTIEDPSMMSIDGRETGTFLFTEQDKYDDYAVKFAKQMWISDVSDEIYVFTFIAPTNSFDSPENIEIRDHFINSIKFLGDSELEIEPQQKSRFD